MIDNRTIEKANRVVEILKDRGYEAEVCQTNKNGIDVVGITMGSGDVRPNIYPDFDMNIDSIANGLIGMYERTQKATESEGVKALFEDISKFDSVKGDIIPYITSGVIPGMATRKYLDLNVYYKIVRKEYSVTIKQEYIDKWGVTEEQLFEMAKENVKGKFTIENISDIIPVPDSGMFMKVISLPGRIWGASALLFPEIFTELDDGKDISIIPSSIHELIALKADDQVGMGLADMIRSVNETSLDPSDILSDHPYIYTNGEIKEV